MVPEHTVLLLGATGRTGGRVLDELLRRGARVHAVVRSAGRLPAAAVDDPRLTVTVADFLSLSDEELAHQLRGCDAVISCLGHTASLRGVFGRPRDLVTRATERVCRALETVRPAAPVRFVLMSSVSVARPGGRDARRGSFEKAVVWLLRALLPPARDNQRAADFLLREIGTAHPYVQWVAVRPDSLREGEGTPYALHEGLVSSLRHPDTTTMANVAHYMGELVTDPEAWAVWHGKLPVIVDDPAA